MAKAKGIFKRGNKYWIRWTDPLTHEQKRESVHSDKYKDAEALLTKRKNAILDGKQPEIVKPIATYTFSQLCEEYLKWAARQRGYKQKSYTVDLLKRQYGTLRLRQFSTMLAEQYQTDCLAKKLKPATINRHVAALKHMFTKAVDWNMVEEDVLKRIRRAKQLEENNRRLRYLTEEEAGQLIDVCSERLKPIVITALNTGMRKEEILSLTWKQVDLSNGLILLDRTKSGRRREIPINNTLTEVLKRLPRRIDGGYVFSEISTGKRYKSIQEGFRNACTRAKIQDLKFHDLRHTFASWLVMKGQDITTVSKLLGHATLTMTLRYAHLAPNHLKNAVEVLSFNATEKRLAQNQHN